MVTVLSLHGEVAYGLRQSLLISLVAVCWWTFYGCPIGNLYKIILVLSPELLHLMHIWQGLQTSDIHAQHGMHDNNAQLYLVLYTYRKHWLTYLVMIIVRKIVSLYGVLKTNSHCFVNAISHNTCSFSNYFLNILHNPFRLKSKIINNQRVMPTLKTFYIKSESTVQWSIKLISNIFFILVIYL